MDYDTFLVIGAAIKVLLMGALIMGFIFWFCSDD